MAKRSSKPRARHSKEVQDLLDQARRLAEFDAGAAARLYLAEESGCRMQDYLRRGRQHEGLSTDVLQARLVDSYRCWAANPRARAEFAAVHDLVSEYEIRGTEFPDAEIAPYFEVVKQTAMAIFATRDEEEKRELGEAIMNCWDAAPRRRQ
jgi:hypothetical protein